MTKPIEYRSVDCLTSKSLRLQAKRLKVFYQKFCWARDLKIRFQGSTSPKYFHVGLAATLAVRLNQFKAILQLN